MANCEGSMLKQTLQSIVAFSAFCKDFLFPSVHKAAEDKDVQ